MALKQIMIQKQIDTKRGQLEAVSISELDIETRSTELERSIEEAKTDEELAVVEEFITGIESEREVLLTSKTKLEQEIATLEGELEQLNSKNESKEVRKVPEKIVIKENQNEERDALNAFIRSKGQVRAGIKVLDAEAIIPVDISYTPQKAVETVVDLSKLVTTTNVTTGSGNYPILKRATAKLSSVAELVANPELAKPEFTEIAWAVETYRGAIPISQESIDDAAVDLVSIVSENANEQKINTTNYEIAAVLKTFGAKTIDSLDDLKSIINVDLDVAYARNIVATQSFFQWLDTLKDLNGQYLLKQDITSPSGYTLLGSKIEVVSDTLFGLAGDELAFIGDLKRAILYANRKEISMRWVDSEIYGQYLQAGTRFDVKKADAKAGYFVTYTAV